MDHFNDEHQHGDHSEYDMRPAMGFVAGILVGALAGATTALLLAPQSGQRTRRQIQHKSLELREQASDKIDEAMEQAHATSQQISSKVQKQAKKIQKVGQDALDDQKERWSQVVEAGQKAVKGQA
jgi:gas vesicle protein